MHKVRTLAALAGLFAALALAIPTAAYASSSPDVKPGSACTADQAKKHAKGHHHGDTYECRETKPGCYLWKFAGKPTGQWIGGPAHCSSPKCTPTPTPSATLTATPTPSPATTPTASISAAGSPAASHSATPPASTGASAAGAPATTPATPAGTLPVTGPPVWLIVLVALAFCGCGALLILAARASMRNGRTTESTNPAKES